MKIYLLITTFFLGATIFNPSKKNVKQNQITVKKINNLNTKYYSEPNSKLWHDLITPDLNISKEFYGKIFNWTFVDVNFKGIKYTTIYNNDKIIGGMIEITSAKNSTWITSLPLSNEDLNNRIKTVMSNGAKVLLPPVKLPGRGKQVVFEGLQGEEFSLISQNDYTSKMDTSEANGNWLGIELWASDVENAKEFYKNAFEVNVEKTEYDNKAYWLFTLESKTLAGMIQNPVTNQGSQWVPYIKMDDPAASVTMAKKASGSVLLAPSMKIREGKIGIIQDPHGAIIAIQKK
ncbi:MAG: VOC family protein [Polaribacter sp.]|nr:VOC family protein [Polaribacter sp.]